MKNICSNCIGEEYLSSYIRKNGILDECSYCGKRKKVLGFREIIDMIEDGLLYLYDDPVNGLGWENGEYVEGTSKVQDSYDLFEEYFDGGKKSFIDLISCFSDRLWCKKDFYDLDDSQESKYTWESFKYLTKYKFRYFFNIKNYFSEDDYSKYKNPYDILTEIMRISKRIKLFTILPKGTIIYRAREGKHLTNDELCSPEPHQCTYSNRFSPAGISMFYGSSDEKTCLAEIDKRNNVSIGKWEVMEDILIFGLTYKFHFSNQQYFYKKFPSIIDKERREYYHDYKFILDFASDISQIVIKNKNENIDYVPTQIVTEYLKLNKKGLKGISYYSVVNGHKNYCLFLDKQQCKDETVIKMVDSFYVSSLSFQ
ncbi:MAG: HEPN-associated N-terminal domain-containing protein [Treponema sp.]|nr:HEPN-associated N-terminal domain-containing protein [Treponema sp.]